MLHCTYFITRKIKAKPLWIFFAVWSWEKCHAGNHTPRSGVGRATSSPAAVFGWCTPDKHMAGRWGQPRREGAWELRVGINTAEPSSDRQLRHRRNLRSGGWRDYSRLRSGRSKDVTSSAVGVLKVSSSHYIWTYCKRGAAVISTFMIAD